MPPAVGRRKVELLARHEVVLTDVDLVLSAIDLTRLRSISFWDALIVAAARSAHCSVLFTEDLEHGAMIEGLEIVDPFR